MHVCLFSTFSLSGCFTYAGEVHVNRSLPEGDRECLCVCVCMCAHISSRPRLSGHWVSWRLQGCVKVSREGGGVCRVACRVLTVCMRVCVRAVPGQEVEQHGDASPLQSLCSISDSPLLTDANVFLCVFVHTMRHCS